MGDFDVVVIGGGPAGAAAAISLARKGRYTGLFEAKAVGEWKIGETLAPQSRQILHALGVWDAFLSDGHLSSPGNCSSWGSADTTTTDFIFNPYGCGWQLDRGRFETRLLEAAENAGAKIFRGEIISHLQWVQKSWQLKTEAGSVRASFVIDATGRGAMIARQIGQLRRPLDQLVSIYATASSSLGADSDARTLIEAVPSGWWYSALTPNGKRIVAYQTDADLLREMNWRDLAWFRKFFDCTTFLGSYLRERNYTIDLPPALTSAHSGKLALSYGEGWLAIGDAAQSFDPLSGQGLFSALFAGNRAAEILGSGSSTLAMKFPDYESWLSNLWQSFLENRKRTYLAEQRWPNNPFWQRRH